MNWFRRARQADPAWNLAKTLVQMAVFWSFFLFVLPPWLMAIGDHFGIPAFRSDAGRGVAIVLFLSASALGLFSAVTMAVQGHGTPLPLDGPRKMVIAGPYAWVRNPMVVAGLAQGAAIALWHGSLILGVYVIAGGIVWHWAVRPLEEADLERTFGAEYAAYRKSVPLWWPQRRQGRIG